MSSTHDRMAQLVIWSRMISELSERIQRADTRTRFEDILFIDELKALHAIAQSKFDQLEAATGPEQAELEVEVQSAWIELAAAFDRNGNQQAGG